MGARHRQHAGMNVRNRALLRVQWWGCATQVCMETVASQSEVRGFVPACSCMDSAHARHRGPQVTELEQFLDYTCDAYAKVVE